MEEITLKYKWEDLPAASVFSIDGGGFRISMRLLILRDGSIDATADLYKLEDGQSRGTLVGRIAEVNVYDYWEDRATPIDRKIAIVKRILEMRVSYLTNATWGQQA